LVGGGLAHGHAQILVTHRIPAVLAMEAVEPQYIDPRQVWHPPPVQQHYISAAAVAGVRFRDFALRLS
jgi:hypothetical protein